MNKETIRDRISRNIASKYGIIPTKSQDTAIEVFSEFISSDDPQSLFILKGYAGTGKTTIINGFIDAVKSMGMKVVLMASTGRAAKTLELATRKKSYTIHRVIYTSDDLFDLDSDFSLTSNKYENTFFIVDESSMIGSDFGENIFGSGNLLEDLVSYVYSSNNCRMMFVGDTAQLPPVGAVISDALNSEKMSDYYGMEVFETTLTDVVRQDKISGILHNATMLRKFIDKGSDTDSIYFKGFEDFRFIDGSELVDEIESSYRRYGRDNCIVICFSNKRALQYNMGIRQRIFEYDSILVKGEKLIVSRNNYFYAKKKDRSDFIANGEMITTGRIYHRENIYDLDFASTEIYLTDRDDCVDVKMLLSSLTDEKAQISREDKQKLYNNLYLDYSHLNSQKKINMAIRKDEYWGALEVKYGYAITAHKSQGGQWDCVFIDLGHLSYMPMDRNMLRWLYTSVTRAKEKIYLVNCPKYIQK